MDFYDKASLYEQVASDLRRRLAAEEWIPGAQMPSERQTAESYGVSRVTARRALKALESEGLIVVLPQRGVFRAP